MLSLVFLSGCFRYDPADGKETAGETAGDSATDTDTDTDADSDTDSDADSDADTDTDTDADWSTGVTEVSEDGTSFADQGYVLTKFAVGPDYRVAMTTPDGAAPTFYVLWPATDDPTAELPVVLQLHGGSLGLPGGYNEESCSQAWADESASSNLIQSAFARLLATGGAIVVGPADPWCDGWTGLGPADPADPAQAGFVLAQGALNYVRHGQTRFGVDETNLTVMGTSFGSPGAFWYATHDPDIRSVILDSGFTDAVRMYADADYSPVPLDERQAMLAHVMGGAPFEADGSTPSAWYDRYAAWSLVESLDSGAFALPVFHLWNAQDPLSTAPQHEDVAAALAAYDGAGTRYVEWDVSHPDPDHTQTKDVAGMYAAYGAWRFAQGREVVVHEVERSGGPVGAVVHARGDVQDYSDESGWEATAADGPGTMVEIDLGVVPAGAALEVVTFVDVEDAPDNATPVCKLHLYADGVEVDSAELNQRVGSWGDFDSRSLAISAATLGTTSDGSAYSYALEAYGNATVKADVVLADW